MRRAYRGEDASSVARVALDFCGKEYLAVAGRYAMVMEHGNVKQFVEAERQEIIDFLTSAPEFAPSRP